VVLNYAFLDVTFQNSRNLEIITVCYKKTYNTQTYTHAWCEQNAVFSVKPGGMCMYVCVFIYIYIDQ